MEVESMNQTDARIEEQAQVGKCCHQCRQRRMDVVGTCVTKKRTRPCAVKMCPSCLWNRYGEIAEEVASNPDWRCPKCRGICNCSICRKREGKEPTGILVRTAKDNGCSNASELLEKEGSDKYSYKKKVKPEDVAEQDNSAEENHAAVKKPKRAKRQELNDSSAGCSEENAAAKKIKIPKTKPVPEEKEEEVNIPQGTESITVSSIDLPPENAASVLQFLEFCSAFGKALGLREGQAEDVLREILSGRSTRSQEHSTLIQMIIQLLTLILVDRGQTSVGLSATDDRWFTVLGECLAESEVKLAEFPPEMFEKGIAEYEEMDSTQRLKLLNFLCDETLGTEVLRNCIDNPKSVERKKDAKEKLNTAKKNEKELEKKMQDKLTKAEAENNGVELTLEQRLAIVSQMDAESENVHFEKQKALEMLSKTSQEYDEVLRTSPVELDDNGLILWRLNSYKEEPNILLQDLGSWSDVCPHEKWFAFSPEQKPEVEKYNAFKRKKRLLEQKKGKIIL